MEGKKGERVWSLLAIHLQVSTESIWERNPIAIGSRPFAMTEWNDSVKKIFEKVQVLPNLNPIYLDLPLLSS